MKVGVSFLQPHLTPAQMAWGQAGVSPHCLSSKLRFEQSGKVLCCRAASPQGTRGLASLSSRTTRGYHMDTQLFFETQQSIPPKAVQL